jgi:hypothetical protein
MLACRIIERCDLSSYTHRHSVVRDFGNSNQHTRSTIVIVARELIGRAYRFVYKIVAGAALPNDQT